MEELKPSPLVASIRSRPSAACLFLASSELNSPWLSFAMQLFFLRFFVTLWDIFSYNAIIAVVPDICLPTDKHLNAYETIDRAALEKA
ncbi:MAG: hypothetical protein LBU32_27775 [Clostridiales bacterium]|nr:hypothetical protein [Clostridiales bacterium]